jgi:hypothetical protein
LTRSSTEPAAAGVEGTGGITLAAGVFAGSVLLTAVNACAIAITVSVPSAGLPLRVAHHVLDAAETLGLGALAALAAGAFVRFVRMPWWAVLSAATIAIVYWVIGWRLARVASHVLEGRFEWAIFVGYFVLLGVGIPVALRVAALLSRRPRLRFLPAALAVCVIVGDELYLPDDYPDMHCLVALGAAVFAGAGLAPLAERAGRQLWRSRAGRAALVATGLFALFGIAWPPSNATRLELFRQPCAIASWVLATTLWRAPRLHEPVQVPPSRWVQDR